MIIQRLSEKRLKKYWSLKLPHMENSFGRFAEIGLFPQDWQLTDREIVCACSLMLERKDLHNVHQAFYHFCNECSERNLSESFFLELQNTISDLDRNGLRDQSRKLRKLGQGVATMIKDNAWGASWGKELDQMRASAIIDEPFLPQKG